MEWKAHNCQGTIYDLSHLHPFAFDLRIPAVDGKPERVYLLNVIFSIHCFSRGAKEDEIIPAHLAYSDNRETRIFDFDRYELSKSLPEIIRSLDRSKCFQDRHGSFYVFKLMHADGKPRYYSVFFELSKAGKKAGLNVFVSSAHARDEPPYNKNMKPIRFHVLVYNVWIGKQVKPAP